MIITCPSCSTKFNVSDRALEPRGKKLRCARCEHTWHQDPVGGPVPAPAPPPPPPPPPPKPRKPARPAIDIPMEMEPGGAPAKGGASQPGSKGPTDIPMEVGGPPPRRPQETDEDLAELDNILGKMKGGGTSFDDGPMPDELDDFEEEDEEFQRFMRSRGKGGDDDDDDDYDDMIGDDDTDPLPRVFTGPRPRQGRRGSGVLKGLIIALVVLWVFALSGWFFRDHITAYVPQLAPVYRALSLNVSARQDLTLANVVAKIEVADANRYLVVLGKVVNPTGNPMQIPDIQLTLLDKSKTVLRSKQYAPPQPALEGNSEVDFELSLENPDAAAADYSVQFLPRQAGH